MSSSEVAKIICLAIRDMVFTGRVAVDITLVGNLTAAGN
jgi:hypothetical protein